MTNCGFEGIENEVLEFMYRTKKEILDYLKKNVIEKQGEEVSV